jgi:soluble lytic murein transglycosylase
MSKRLALCVTLLVILAVVAVGILPLLEQKLYPREYEEYVEKYASEFSVPEALVYAVIHTESNFDANAVSSAGANGLMQLIPETMTWLSKKLGEKEPTGDILDPETNIKYGTCYLQYLYEKFGDWNTALAAYNAGHGRVSGWLEDESYTDDGITLKNIPIKETSDYVNKVSRAWERYKDIYYGE